ncbi:MAG: hypothetical protein WAQ52_15140 [Terriglobales bacterium]
MWKRKPAARHRQPANWQTVSGLAPVTEPGRGHDHARRALLGFVAGTALFLGIMWSPSPWMVLTVTALLIGLAVWGMLFVLRSPNVSRKSRRSAVWLYGWVPFLCVLKVGMVVAAMRRR